MKIALAQLNFHIGNFEANTAKIIEHIKKAQALRAELVVFSELSVCGYPPRDFLEFNDFIERCQKSLSEIATHCNGIAAIVGAPSINPNPRGKDLYNSAYFLADGQINQVVHKALLPNYDVFDEYRYFEPCYDFSLVEWKGHKIALTICEDLWNLGDDPLYVACPMEELAKDKPDLMINIAASPFDYAHAENRQHILALNARKYGLPLVYVNQVGAQTELLFDGGSMILNNCGEVRATLPYFQEALHVFDPFDADEENQLHTPGTEIERIHDALVMGIKDYFGKMGFKKAILGLSGGIDSAVTMVLAARALGSENVLGVLLPSEFSSDHSVKDAIDLAENLGSPWHKISIHEMVKAGELSLEPYFKGLPFSLAEENLQARVRAVLLMALSNKFGHILLNTSNKSEAAVGYGTLYGDMCGGMSVLGDVYKTQVYQLAHHINKDTEVIPVNSITKPPSAELRPNQKDSDSLPEYDILDSLLREYIENRKGPNELHDMGFDKALIDRVLKLVNTNEYKRHQTPPILRVSPKAFGMGRKMPIVAKYLS